MDLEVLLQTGQFEEYVNSVRLYIEDLSGAKDEITHLRQLPDGQMTTDEFNLAFDKYIGMIKKADHTAKELINYIDTDQGGLKNKFEKWASKQDDVWIIEDWDTLRLLRNQAKLIRRASEFLQRNLTELYCDYQDQREKYWNLNTI